MTLFLHQSEKKVLVVTGGCFFGFGKTTHNDSHNDRQESKGVAWELCWECLGCSWKCVWLQMWTFLLENHTIQQKTKVSVGVCGVLKHSRLRITMLSGPFQSNFVLVKHPHLTRVPSAERVFHLSVVYTSRCVNQTKTQQRWQLRQRMGTLKR